MGIRRQALTTILTCALSTGVVAIEGATSGIDHALAVELPANGSPFQNRIDSLRGIETTITKLREAIEGYKKDISDFNAITALWDVMRKQFEAFDAAAKNALTKCAEYHEDFRAFRNAYPQQGQRFAATNERCQDVLKTTDTLLSDYRRAFTRIEGSIGKLRDISAFTEKSYAREESILQLNQERKRLLESVNKMPGMPGASQAMSPDDFKGL
ncbi:hypothetical protein PMI42_00380 [Bradyrhizobium sp. YR681]|uniref:hypothetical protein n=1 Tax=Bradyrhizobium sp. YR681 TaxID=1144344 RepID=UPI0002712283|nr:hypothetical protein [Bradyrhizobium sp. YR681]EJN16053.1 hypothetical protein PMI42_00380 [Bradyrhizobium sp. YR681]